MLFFAYTAVLWTEYSCVRSVLAYGCFNNSSLRRVLSILSFEAVCMNEPLRFQKHKQTSIRKIDTYSQ